MPLEAFIITVFCWVDEGVEAVTGGIKLRICGFAPRLSDSEVIMMEIVGEMLGEPPRLSRRLQLLRGWGHEDVDPHAGAHSRFTTAAIRSWPTLV